jgi:hypothetical protein
VLNGRVTTLACGKVMEIRDGSAPFDAGVTMEREFWAADRNALDGIGYAIELTLCNDYAEDAAWTGVEHKAYSTRCTVGDVS